MDKHKSLSFVYRELLLSILLGALVPLLLSFFKVLKEPSEAIIIGILLAVSTFIIRTLFLATKSQEDLEKLRKVDRTRRRIRRWVTALDSNFESIIAMYSQDPNDLYMKLYQDQLKKLGDHMNDAIELGKYYIEGNLERYADDINNLFSGKDTDYLCSTCEVISACYHITTSGSLYLHSMHSALKEQRLKGVKRLFIYDSLDELKNIDIVLLASFHENVKNYECAFISREDFMNIADGFDIKNFSPDFGIYGNHFVWETYGETSNITKGCFCRDKRRINDYSMLHNRLWKKAEIDRQKPQIRNDIRDIETLYKEWRKELKKPNE